MRTLQALFFAVGALGIAACGTGAGGETGSANVIVSAGAYHTCQIINPPAEVECWGNNGSGRATPPPGVLFSTVSLGYSYTCGLRASKPSLLEEEKKTAKNFKERRRGGHIQIASKSSVSKELAHRVRR